MDKASIVGDAVLYVQQLQIQAKKLKAEIAGLESSLVLGAERYNGLVEIPKKIQVACSHHPMCGKIFQVCKFAFKSKKSTSKILNKFIKYMGVDLQMDVFQVEERGFYVRLACNRGERVAVSLYKALESLTGFNIQSSNLATFSETFVLTFTLNVSFSFHFHFIVIIHHHHHHLDSLLFWYLALIHQMSQKCRLENVMKAWTCQIWSYG